MNYFKDLYRMDPQNSIGVTNLLSNITTRPGSHKGGWSRLLKCQLSNIGFKNVTILDNKRSLNEFDVIIFDLGAEFSGVLNLFGGLDEKVFKRLSELEMYTGKLFSWRNDIPDISILESRRNNQSSCESFKRSNSNFLQNISRVLKSTVKFNHVYETNKMLIGDSHTPGVWTPEYMIERRDGRTLQGMVTHKTISKYLDEHPQIEEVTIHASSIDIRHHVMRKDNPKEYLCDLQGKIVSETKLKTTLVHTMGIEDESRELPKTGFFKGTPFFGSWEERQELRNLFVSNLEILHRFSGGRVKTLKYPDYFFDNSGKLKFDVMEVPQSVHISPEHYRWNLEKNELRW